MKFRVIILLFACTILFGQLVSAKAQMSMKELNQLADKALQLTKFGEFEDAKKILEQFGENFSNTTKDLTMDDLRIITVVHHEALSAVTSVSLSHEDRVEKVTSFRLATDAITSHHQPLWLGMEDTILNSFQDVKNAALEGNAVLYNEELNAFLAKYAIILPSIKIDLPVELVQKLDSRITYIDRYRSTFSEQKWLQELDLIGDELESVFSGMNKDESDPSIWWVIIMTGGIILTTLSYVSWRQFRGQKKFKKSSKKDRQ